MKNINIVLIDDYRADFVKDYLELYLWELNISVQSKIFYILNDESKAYITDVNNAVNIVIMEPYHEIAHRTEWNPESIIQNQIKFIQSVEHIPFLLLTTQNEQLMKWYLSTNNITYLRKSLEYTNPFNERILQAINDNKIRK